MSEKYESGGRGAGTIGNNAGDIGGKSYGTYQIATNTGTMNNFLQFLAGQNRNMYLELKRHKVGSSGFDNAWKRLAKSGSFGDLQHKFIKKSHYDPVVSRAQKQLGINFNSQPKAVQDVIWSLGVQHGGGGAMTVLRNSGVKSTDSPAVMINKIYDERSKVNRYFSSSSANIKKSVKNRFANERKDALASLSGGGGGSYSSTSGGSGSYGGSSGGSSFTPKRTSPGSASSYIRHTMV